MGEGEEEWEREREGERVLGWERVGGGGRDVVSVPVTEGTFDGDFDSHARSQSSP